MNGYEVGRNRTPTRCFMPLISTQLLTSPGTTGLSGRMLKYARVFTPKRGSWRGASQLDQASDTKKTIEELKLEHFRAIMKEVSASVDEDPFEAESVRLAQADAVVNVE